MLYTKQLFTSVSQCEHKFREQLREFKKTCNEKGIVAGKKPDDASLQKLLSDMVACLKMTKIILGMNCETFVGILTDELEGAVFTADELNEMGADKQ